MCNNSCCKCQEQSSSKPHVHAENMKLYAEDAAETDKPWERWEVLAVGHQFWNSCLEGLYWHPRNSYRRKRKMRVVNGFSVPAPETKVPSIGTTIFIADPAREEWYSYTSWCTALYDRLWFARGLVFLNRDDAIANAKAMCFINLDSKPV